MNINLRKYAPVVIGLALLALLAACSVEESESQQVQQQQDQYVRNQPLPVFDWSLERHLMIELYRSRNNAVSTFSLTWDPFRGKISWSCPSIGYPIPGGTQLTNPEQYAFNGTTLPQAEPNGLFSPATSAGTYVMCVNPDGTVSPVYNEDNVRTYPQPMVEMDGQLVPAPNTQPSLRIDTTPPAEIP